MYLKKRTVLEVEIFSVFISHLGLHTDKFSLKSMTSIEHILRLWVVPIVQCLIGRLSKNSRKLFKFLRILMQFFMRNPNMLLVLKSERLKMNYHRFFEKSAFFFKKNAKKPKKYLTSIFIKIHLSWEKFITKMISAKNYINSESFNGFGRGRQINMAISHGFTL